MSKANGAPTRAKSREQHYKSYAANQTAENNKFRKLVKLLKKHPTDRTAFKAYERLVGIVSAKVKKAYPLDLEVIYHRVKVADAAKKERAERAAARS